LALNLQGSSARMRVNAERSAGDRDIEQTV
jgi:hypothetical protein